MIARLSGKLIESELTSIVIDVNGVGYELAVPMSTYDSLPLAGETVSLFTHLHVREDALQLYGFSTREERSLFMLLMTVSGVGSRIALNVLSCMSVGGFCQTILAGDVKALSKVNGIGKRSAERLIVELRGKVGDLAVGTGGDGEMQAGGALSTEAQDAIAALETLGFRTESARKTVQSICQTQDGSKTTAENLIRKALALLNS